MESIISTLAGTPVFLLCGLLILMVGCIYAVYVYVKTNKLDDIREDVYKLFLEAERKYTVSGCGKEKMDYVIRKTYDILPSTVRFFVTEKMLRYILQRWFIGIKDILDDGKLNGSANQ